MAHWLFERGIGEDRAILVDQDHIIEAVIELPTSLRAGAIVPARLTRILIPGRRGIIVANGVEALLEPIPAGLTEGATLNVEIVREAIGEEGRAKLAKARATPLPPRPGPTLEERIRPAVPEPAAGPDRFEEHGWGELMEEARTGEVAFAGGALRISLTPAMTLIDVDGALGVEALAVAGAAATARAIRRLGLGGSIGIDLPTLSRKEDRQAAAAALDAALPQPFERTAVNGFGFLQVVRRLERPSLCQIMQEDPPGAAARALLRRGERMTGALVITAAPSVIARLEREPGWIASLSRRCGGAIALRPDPALPIFGGHVHATI